MAITLKKVKANENIFNNDAINNKYKNIAGALNNTSNDIQQNIFKTATHTNSTSTTSAPTSTQNLFRDNYPTYTYTGGSGGGGMIDISNILKAYEQGAEANRATVKQTYESRRNDLLTSLKRFQEQNAKDVERQQRVYLSDQAALESAIAQADRQNRINAASRGLGGSGLQQLAQLQNLLSQGQTISDMATENQNTLESLRTALANQEEDTQTSLNNILDVYNNALLSIDSDLAANKANIEYQARENAASRVAAASSAAAQIAAQNAAYDAQAREDENAFKAQLDDAQRIYKKALEGATSSKKVKEAKETYEASVAEILKENAIPSTSSYYKSAYDYLTNAYTSALDNTSNLESKLNLWKWITDPAGYVDIKNELKQTPGKFRIW